MVKHIQTNFRQQPTNCLGVFDHFVRLACKGLKNELQDTNRPNLYLRDVSWILYQGISR